VNTILLLSALLVAPQQNVFVQQNNGGWCSPIFVNVTGPITVNCTGVDPKALEVLNAELRKGKLDSNEAIRRANEWAAKYKELEKRLAESRDDRELSRQAEKYLHEGDLEKAGSVLDQILDKEEAQVDLTASNHYNRALISELEFKPLDALPHFRKAFEYRPKSLKYASAYAWALIRQKDFANAERALLPALDEALKLLPGDPSHYAAPVAVALTALANIYFQTQRWKEAEQAYQRALDEYLPHATKEPDKYPPDLGAGIQMELGNLYARTGHFAEAQKSYQGALDTLAPLAGKNPGYLPQVAALWGNVGNMYQFRHQFPEAQEADERARDIWLKIVQVQPAYSPHLAGALNNLGIVYRAENEPDKAAEAYRDALKRYREAAEQDHALYDLEVAGTLNNLGVLERYGGNLTDALRDSQEALDIRRCLVRANSVTYGPDLGESLNNVALVYYSMGREESDPGARAEDYSISECLHYDALAIYSPLAEEHPEVFEADFAKTISGLGNVFAFTGREQDAVDAYQEVITIRRRLVKDHCVASFLGLEETLNNLGNVYINMGRFADANVVYRAADEARQSAAGCAELRKVE
jgi:tetratricopeptide (TPR) repeat protein